MGIIQNFINGIKNDKKEQKNFETSRRIEERYTEKSKSHNERELEDYVKEQREKKIKEVLTGIKAQESHELWSGKGNPLNAPNIFKNNDCIFRERGNNFLR